MRYKDPGTGRFARRPEPAAKPKPKTWHRAAVRLPKLFRPRGPWRETRDEAVKDAVAAGLATFDRRQQDYILPVPAVIDTVQSFERPPD